jgi:peptidyl-tRNA hydrolase, PTH1 family
MKILVGLGNPGEKYIKTRHNIGFMFLDFLAEGEDWKFNKKFNALILEKKDLTLIKPMTFMNNSGLSVRSFLDYYKLLPKKMKLFVNKDTDLSDILTVVHDDLDIDFGKHKISINSSSAGHKGVQSIINHLKTKRFKRIRLGVKNENKEHIPGASFVLQNFLERERGQLNDIFREIIF